MGRRPTKKYVDNDELFDEIVRSREAGQPTERLGQLFMAMHDHILSHKNFNRYSQQLKEDMRSYSYYRIFKCGIYSFDLSRKADTFNYFTSAIFNNYIAVLNKYYKELNFRQKYMKEVLLQMKDNYQSFGSEGQKMFIDNFKTYEDLINNEEEHNI